MAALVDTVVLVYRFDSRFPQRQQVATEILRRGIVEDSVRLPHQAIVAYAEHFGLSELLSEDFQHDRLYGSVPAVNPFV